MQQASSTMYSGYDTNPGGYDASPVTPSRSPSNSIGSQNSGGWNAPGYRASMPQGDVPNAVHKLLESTKRLQDILQEWSLGRADEVEVSDVYVQIGTEFNAIITAFAYHQIDLSDIHSVPQEMRTVLEQCLAEEPSPEALAQFMPELKTILIKLLRGLQTRQDTWQARTSMAASNSPRNSR